MRSRRFLLLLLLFVSLDFAVPYEPTARGWYEFEDEEESVHPAGRRAERPQATSARPASPDAAATVRARSAPIPDHARQPYPAPVTRLARADTSSSPAPASPEAH
ncbi:MAG TPA: hypothetical protein VGM22_19970 [Methylomirabilota bacterium]